MAIMNTENRLWETFSRNIKREQTGFSIVANGQLLTNNSKEKLFIDFKVEVRR